VLGDLQRIDNFFANFDNYLLDLRSELIKVHRRKQDVLNELENKESYTDEIESLRKEIKEIDEKLGVDKK